MRDYFSLQFRILNRQLDEFGIKPLYGYLIGVVLFVGLTAYLWFATTYAPYIYALLALSMTTIMADAGKINFILQHFSKPDLFRIRAIENLIATFPFISCLLFYHEWIIAIAVLLMSVVLSFSSTRPSGSLVIPTPFSRNPFEFPIGFRNYILVLMLAAFLLVMAILYTNANLGLFACGLVLLVCLMFYMTSEQPYLVWIYNRTPGAFLGLKIRNAIISALLLFLPFAFVMLLVFPTHALYLLVILVLGLLYLIVAILGKYAFYPSSMNLPQGLVMALSFWFPPLLIFLIPYFYRRCLHRLKPFLS